MKTALAVIGAYVVAHKVTEVIAETYRVGLLWQALGAIDRAGLVAWMAGGES